LQHFFSDQDAIQNRINQLIELDGNRRKAFDHFAKNQEKYKGEFDKKLTHKILQHFSSLTKMVQNSIDLLIELDENIRKAFDHFAKNQEKVKDKLDKKIHLRNFQKGDLILMWNEGIKKSRKHGKLESLWLGPCRIKDVVGDNSFYLSHLDGKKLPFPMNRKILKLFVKDET
jgi:intein/homing endonuclease